MGILPPPREYYLQHICNSFFCKYVPLHLQSPRRHTPTDEPQFFFTEGKIDGSLRRYTPQLEVVSSQEDPAFRLLHEDGNNEGILEHLVLLPDGSFYWTEDEELGEKSAESYYQFSRGVDCQDGMLYLASEGEQALFVLDLDKKVYVKEEWSDKSGGYPSEVVYLPAFDGNTPMLFITDGHGVKDAGVFVRTDDGKYTKFLESDENTAFFTGLSFTPDGKSMYVAMEREDNEDELFVVTREDGLPFNGPTKM